MPSTSAATIVLALLGAILAGCGAPKVPDAPPAEDVQVRLERVAAGFANPVGAIPDPHGGVMVLEQVGRITNAGDGRAVRLDVRDRVKAGGEQGLLGAAVAADGALWVHYSGRPDGNTVVSRFPATGSGWDAGKEAVMFTAEQPYANHNGGSLLWGPDGYLYLGLGDGGSAGDPENRAQDKESPLGKVLRWQALCAQTCTLAPAPGNPFIGKDGRDDIWVYGVRNPWRMAFDHETGDLWIGDVGQNNIEEVDRLPAGSAGANLGWRVFEGTHRYASGEVASHVEPVAEYDHRDGRCSITGGAMYRGHAIASLVGRYVYADYCAGTVWSLHAMGRHNEIWLAEVLLETGLSITSFGEDAAGELYLVESGGTLNRLVAD